MRCNWCNGTFAAALPHDCHRFGNPYEGEDAILQKGAAAERARIVAWLREQSARTSGALSEAKLVIAYARANERALLAALIERGEHVAGSVKP